MLYLFCQGGPWVVLSWPSGTGMGATPAIPIQRVQLHRSEGARWHPPLCQPGGYKNRKKTEEWTVGFSTFILPGCSDITGSNCVLISSGPQEWSSQSSTVLITSVCFKENRAYHCWITGSPTVSLHFWLECVNFLVLRK